MSAEERVAVKTYVPQYQKEIWTDHADELDMSLSEFVRTMVQSGRSSFEVPGMGGAVAPAGSTERSAANGGTTTSMAGDGSVTGSTSADGGGTASADVGGDIPGVDTRTTFENRVVEALERDGPLDWDALVDALIDDVEGELDGALERLQERNRIRHSGRDGGYVLLHE